MLLSSSSLFSFEGAGKTPTRKKLRNAPLAQLVEQLTLNQWVLGSSPRWCTKKIPRKKLQGIFYCCFPEKQELGAPSGERRAHVFQAVKKTLVGARVARPGPFVYEITSPENALLR